MSSFGHPKANPGEATMLSKGLEHTACEERVMNLGFFSPTEKRLRRDAIAIYNCPIMDCREDFLRSEQ